MRHSPASVDPRVHPADAGRIRQGAVQGVQDVIAGERLALPTGQQLDQLIFHVTERYSRALHLDPLALAVDQQDSH